MTSEIFWLLINQSGVKQSISVKSGLLFNKSIAFINLLISLIERIPSKWILSFNFKVSIFNFFKSFEISINLPSMNFSSDGEMLSIDAILNKFLDGDLCSFKYSTSSLMITPPWINSSFDEDTVEFIIHGTIWDLAPQLVFYDI